ncbi:MAG: ABC transporter permease [Thermoplasmata archaeon]|nr:ABC transporter permease [Thermoplasmata archaeon]
MALHSLAPLKSKPGRTAATITALAIAVALAVVLLSLGSGIKSGHASLLEERGTDIYVGGQGSGLLFETFNLFPDGRKTAGEIANMSEVRAAVPHLYGNLPFSAFNTTSMEERNGSGIIRITLYGVVAGGADDFVGTDQPLINGTGLETPGDPFYDGGTYNGSWTGEIVLSEKAAEEMDADVGDVVYVNTFRPVNNDSLEDWMENATPFTVSAVGDLGGRKAVVHLSELQYISGLREDEVVEIRVDLRDPGDAAAVAERINGEYPVAAFTIDDLAGEADRYVSTFQGLGSILSLLAMVVASVFVLTVMTVSVRERRREIGILRAIGISRATILKETAFQSLFLTSVGCAAGMGLGLLAIRGIEGYLHGRFDDVLPSGFSFSILEPGVVAVALGLVVVLSLLGSLVALYHINSVKVAEVLRGD